jgi:thiamine-monophosphate kinase
MTEPSLLPTLTVSEFGERALIARITSRLAMPTWVVVGPGDDAAVLAPERGALDVFTTDAHVDGVHFDRRFVPPDAIGHRALAVNLSDLAAMGATPRAVLLSLVLPDALEVTVVDGMLDGLLALAAVHNVSVVGGNISRTPGPMVVDITAIGSVKPRRVMVRTGARPGDGVYVTGTIGEGSVGLHSLQVPRGHPPLTCQEQYLRPQPRVRAGMLLGRNRAASACMDTSDGLVDAVRQIAEASNVGIALDGAALPIADEVRRWNDAQGVSTLDAAVSGGDDYELLFTVRPAHRGRLRGVRRNLGDLVITHIGMVTKGHELSIRTDGEERSLPEGFEHFR